MKKQNALIGQSGGPTAVINASLIGVADAALAAGEIGGVYGMRFGIEGFMQDLLVDLGRQTRRTLDLVRRTPSSALGSCRHKVKEPDFPLILQQLKKYDIGYFFLIGGNDTMDTIHRVEAYCRAQGYELKGVGVPKTVDNDLFGTDHTPGFPSAANYVSRSVTQAGVLARDMRKVDQLVVFQTVGREAGWLAAAGALAKRDEAEAPHLIYMPETAFDLDQCLADVEACLKKHGFCSIVAGEGIHFADGTPVSASQTKDKFSNVEFGAMGGSSAALTLHKIICDRLKLRGEFQIPESLQMCASDRASELDLSEAYACGREAVRLALGGGSGQMVTLVRPAGEYRTILGSTPLAEVAVRAKPMPREFINARGNFPSPAFFEYVKPLTVAPEPFAQFEWLKPATE